MDVTDDVAFDQVAVEDNIVGDAKSAFLEVVVEGCKVVAAKQWIFAGRYESWVRAISAMRSSCLRMKSRQSVMKRVVRLYAPS